MAIVMSASESFQSPKRKRDGGDSIPQSPQPLKALPRISTEIDNLQSEPVETGSPRSAVAGHLQQLDLRGPWVRKLSFQDAGRSRKRFAQMSPEPESQVINQTQFQGDPSPEPFIKHDISFHSTEEAPEVALPPSLQDTSASRIVCKPRARSRSPTVDGDPEDNPMTWHESEITGHNPDDPNDDGYGINGIGFRPTAAIAWSRSQKRKQQIAEYRSREAREARQRRSERRRNGSSEGADLASSDFKAGSKVRFDASIEEVG